MSYPTHRCTQCSLVRCFYPGVTCDECIQHYAQGDHLKHTETDPLTGRPIDVDTLKKFKVSTFGSVPLRPGVTPIPPGPVQIYPSPYPDPNVQPINPPPAPTAPEDIWKAWEIIP